MQDLTRRSNPARRSEKKKIHLVKVVYRFGEKYYLLKTWGGPDVIHHRAEEFEILPTWEVIRTGYSVGFGEMLQGYEICFVTIP